MKYPKLQNIVKKFAPKGTLVNTYLLGDDILIIRKIPKAETFFIKYKKK